MQNDSNLGYAVLKELKNKASLDYCLNRIISENIKEDSIEECLKCNQETLCSGYSNINTMPVDMFCKLYLLIIDCRLGYSPKQKYKAKYIKELDEQDKTTTLNEDIFNTNNFYKY